MVGYWPRVARDLQRLLSSHPDKFDKMSSDISPFEWLANLHQIFNATLMNMDLMINKNNIDRYVVIEVDNQFYSLPLLQFVDIRLPFPSYLPFHRRYENQVKECLDYFDAMRRCQLLRAGTNNAEKTFLAHETWRNLRITCRGFFIYCRAIMKCVENAPDGSIEKVYFNLPPIQIQVP